MFENSQAPPDLGKEHGLQRSILKNKFEKRFLQKGDFGRQALKQTPLGLNAARNGGRLNHSVKHVRQINSSKHYIRPSSLMEDTNHAFSSQSRKIDRTYREGNADQSTKIGDSQNKIFPKLSKNLSGNSYKAPIAKDKVNQINGNASVDAQRYLKFFRDEPLDQVGFNQEWNNSQKDKALLKHSMPLDNIKEKCCLKGKEIINPDFTATKIVVEQTPGAISDADKSEQFDLKDSRESTNLPKQKYSLPSRNLHAHHRNVHLRAEKRYLNPKLSLSVKPQLDQSSYQVPQKIHINQSINNAGLSKNSWQTKFYASNRKGKRPYNEDRYCCCENLQKQYSFNSLIENPTTKSLRGDSTQITNAQLKELGNLSIHCFSVFDGHGGTACSEFLKHNFLTFLLRTKRLVSDPQGALKEAYSNAEQKFIAMSENKKYFTETSGSCAVTCLMINEKIYAANIGDSRAFIFNSSSLCQMTTDHKPTDANEKARILKCGGKIYKEQSKTLRCFRTNSNVKTFNTVRIAPGNLNVSRTLGDIETKLKKYGGLPGMVSPEPEIRVFQRSGYDVLLLASDGLFEAFENKQIQKLFYEFAGKKLGLQHGKSLESQQIDVNSILKDFAEYLTLEAEKLSTDNITVVVVNLRSFDRMTPSEQVSTKITSSTNHLKTVYQNGNQQNVQSSTERVRAK